MPRPCGGLRNWRMMRLRIKGMVPIIIVMSLLVLIAGAMLFKVKYEDNEEQQAWNAVLEADQDLVERAKKALPLVAEYEALVKSANPDKAKVDAAAEKILALFPEFKAPDSGASVKLLPVERMRALLEGYRSIGQTVSGEQ